MGKPVPVDVQGVPGTECDSRKAAGQGPSRGAEMFSCPPLRKLGLMCLNPS